MTIISKACNRATALQTVQCGRSASRISYNSTRTIFTITSNVKGRILTPSACPRNLLSKEINNSFQLHVSNRTPFISSNSIRYLSTTPNNLKDSRSSGPLPIYDELVSQGALKSDDFQRGIIETLQGMHDRLINYHPEPIGKKEPEQEKGLFSKFSSIFNKKEEERLAKEAEAARKAAIPKGLYLYGSVGTGKTMLMDLFYESLDRTDKTRIHFHNFMQQLHGRLHKLKSTAHPAEDAIPFLADELAKESGVFCLDEFQVTDIADAMLLRRLLEELIVNRGVILVTTSNRHPSELYKNGIQRESFLPGIAVLEEHCEVKCLDGGVDYRREKKTYFHSSKRGHKSHKKAPPKLIEEKRFYWPLGNETKKKVEKYFNSVRDGHPVKELKMNFLGRELVLPHSSGRITMCSFDDLCARTLSAPDYIALANNVDTLILTDIPKLQPTTLHRNETRRLITLIDALYESQVKLVCSADGPISEIFGGGSGAHSTDEDPSTMGELTPAQRQMMDDLGLNDVSQVRKSPIFSGEEEKFAVQRAESRLIEMQGPGWGL